MQKQALLTDKWDKYISYLPVESRDIYFTEDYVKLYENDNDIPQCFIYIEGNSILLFPYLKRRIGLLEGEYFDFETPYGYGGPITNTNNPLFINKAFNEFLGCAKKDKIIAGFIRFHPLLDNQVLLSDRIDIIFDRKTIVMHLDLEEDTIWNEQIHPKHRNSIRKAQKLGFSYLVDENLQYLGVFENLYKSTMDRLKVENFYYFNKGYFDGIRNLKDNVFLGLVLYGEEIISGALFFKYGIYGHYHLAGYLEEYRQYNPNNFLIYNTALYFKETGIKLFHLGGGFNSDVNNSLYRFKRRFSKFEYPFYIGKIIFNQGLYEKVCSIWKEMFPEKEKNFKTLFLKYRY